jgi:methionyl-tRNA synthetase
VGELISRHRQKQAIAEAMRVVAEVNKYVSESEPWKLKGEDERERLATVLHVTAQAVSDCNTLLSPFLPHSANEVHRVLGGRGELQPMPHIEEVDDLDGGAGYPIITGDYTSVVSWARHPIEVGAPVSKPSPVFTKLDVAVVDEELARMTSG